MPMNEYMDKYSLSSLFMIVMFYKVTTNTELVNIEPSLLGEIKA